ncbi:type II secretion system F family protein [Noviherbaspirillum sp. UKPF54]|uniref:type II secretion system F family protein n=1 Tax=Noviherbaspirillum sp. UKPF54 TaxID=2601898 RepID=UPI0011B1A4A2|nr:type II secretion system F family protein [Noviherbaspirillum sp. UKPF54]QDZ28283.1 type II secretion system F family protein [Noviherbaspirillum sp. UKPF54]
MPFFNYKARNARGELLQGVLEGADSNAVATYLLNIGTTPVEIVLTKKKDLSEKGSWLERLTAEKITDLDVQLFSRQIYTLLKAGVPIMRGLAGLQESAINKSFARVLKELREALDTGRELSAAMRAFPTVFSSYYVSMVQVGEMTGRLTEIFPRLHDFLQFERSMREQITAALRYPKFVLLAMVSAISVINVFVIPSFAKVFMRAQIELPLMTRLLLASSHFTITYWPVVVGGIAAAALLVRQFVNTANGRYRWDRAKLRIPIAGSIIMKGTMARFARSFALAYKSGIPAAQALSLVAKTVDNAYVASNIEQMRDGVERGETIFRTASTTRVFTPMVLQMIGVGEETGEIDKLMDEIAEMYEREVEYELKTLAARIEPIMIVGMGILVLILALGVFMPMWDLGQVSLHKK